MAGAAAGFVAISSQGCGNGKDDQARQPSFDRRAQVSLDENWSEVREQFAIRPDLIDLSALLISSHPRPVREAINRHRQGLDEDPVGYLHSNINENERRVLERAAEYLNTSSGDIAITDSTTMGLGLIYNGIHVALGQEILTTDQNYYSTDEALRLKAEKSGATVRSVPLYSDSANVSSGELTARIVGAVSPATRVVALTWVHSSTGLKLPLAEISAALDEINDSRAENENILLGIDGVHGFGVEDFEISDLGCDYFAAGCHKWLFGPRGTGIVWASDRGWDNVSPTIPTFMDNSVRDAWVLGEEVTGVTTGRRFSPGGFKPFEHQWATAEAFDFHLDIGKSAVAERTHARLELCRHHPLQLGLRALQELHDLRPGHPLREVFRPPRIALRLGGLGWQGVE